MPKLRDIIKSINKIKNRDLINEENLGDYSPFIVNRCMSYFYDTVLLANEMNMRPDLPSDMQHLFFVETVSVRNRFHPWMKKDISDNIDLIKKAFNVSYKKAIEIEYLLTDKDINIIKESLDEGGIKNG